MQTQKRDEWARRGPGDASSGQSHAAFEGDPILAELRKLYDGIAEEPLPDQLMDLLRKLDEIERNR